MLGDYLRARRELIQPDSVGLPVTGVRRVAGLRREEVAMLADTDDPRFVQLVGELSLSSKRFRQLWARHDVQAREGAPALLHHPQVGDLTLSREKLAIGGAAGQLLVIYHAQPGTSSADKLSLLASLASPTAPVARGDGSSAAGSGAEAASRSPADGP